MPFVLINKDGKVLKTSHMPFDGYTDEIDEWPGETFIGKLQVSGREFFMAFTDDEYFNVEALIILLLAHEDEDKRRMGVSVKRWVNELLATGIIDFEKEKAKIEGGLNYLDIMNTLEHSGRKDELLQLVAGTES